MDESRQDYNIIFIFIDGLRVDHLGCYGYDRKISSNIDALAKEAVLFEQNFTPISWTEPSFISVITSLYPNSHRVLESRKDRLPEPLKTLPEVLNMYGYKTAWFGPFNYLFFASSRIESAIYARGLNGDLMVGKENMFEWLDNNKNNRFFLGFHTGHLHYPYSPSLKYKRSFQKAELKEGRSLYDACILEVDERFIGPLVKKLKDLGLYDKTIMIIFSDHGEEFYEHGGREHGKSLYNEVTHVPLVIRFPWMRNGKRIRELTQTIDIMPTILDSLGISIPHQAQGKSLMGLANGKKPGPVNDYIFGWNSRVGISSIHSKEWKLILHETGRKELYNMINDPGEQDDLYQKEKARALELEERLKEWEATLPSYKKQ